MDALKLIAQDSLKKEVPQIEIGDTIKVDGDHGEVTSC